MSGPGRPLTILAAALAALVAAGACSAQPADGDDMAGRLLACAACHGAAGAGTGSDRFPRLAGKPAGYLLHQLESFRDGRRSYPPMTYLLEFQPDAYLRKMAEYFAAQRPPLSPRAPAEVSDAVLEHGRALALGGDAARGVPACAGCHGPSFTGMEPAIPGLVGLGAGYVAAQLGAWRYGTRTAPAPDCMQTVAGSLTEGDVAAVSAWFASLPIPAEPAAAREGSMPMPLACGSEPR